MTDETITRADLSQAVYETVGLSRNESAELVESVLELMADALVKGEMVKISSFGSFVVRDKKQRIGRNPKTGEEVPIAPRRVLTFRASHVLKDNINDADAPEEGADEMSDYRGEEDDGRTPSEGSGSSDTFSNF